MRGRKPKPKMVKELSGNPGKRRLVPEPRFEPAPASLGASPPAKMPKAGRDLWSTLYPMLEKAGILKATDLPAFEALCLAWANFLQADGETRKPGGMVRTIPSGFQSPSAWVSIRSKAYAEYCKLAEQFGLTPSARSRIKSPQEDSAPDELADFLGPGVVGRIG